MDVSKIIGEVKLRLDRAKKPVICNVSNRHVHLSHQDIKKLFGSGCKLNKARNLMQPGEYATDVTVDILGPKAVIKKVRVMGPPRKYSQVEISRTDSYVLGIKAETRASGEIKNTPGIRLIGPVGSVELPEGVIVARRHIHMAPQDARFFKVKDGQFVRIRTRPPRAVIFEEILVRVSSNYYLECHIDTDEANACDFKSGSEVFLS